MNYYLTIMEKKVIDRRREFSPNWDRSDNLWLLTLLEEISELILSLRGKHDNPPDLELVEIASICINWLEKRKSESEE